VINRGLEQAGICGEWLQKPEVCAETEDCEGDVRRRIFEEKANLIADKNLGVVRCVEGVEEEDVEGGASRDACVVGEVAGR
jgi:hypothetical protein